MQTETSHIDRARPHAERAARVAVPVGAAVVTWLVVLLAVGFVARLDSLSVLDLVPLVVISVLFWPIYLAAPWRPGLTDRVHRTLLRNRRVIVGAVGLLVVRSLPFTPELVQTILDLPFRSAGIMFGAGLFYRELLSPAVSRVLLSFGQWYFVVLWLFILGKLLASLVGRVR